MRAAAHLLRRRSSLYLQHYGKSSTLFNPFPVSPIQPHNWSPTAVVRSRKSSSSTINEPQENPSSKTPPSKTRARKFAAAGAAILVLSAGVWYTTRDQYPLVQHIGLPLPQIFQGHSLEDKAPNTTGEKSLKPGAEWNEVKGTEEPRPAVVRASEHDESDVQVVHEIKESATSQEVEENLGRAADQSQDGSSFTDVENKQEPEEMVQISVEIETNTEPKARPEEETQSSIQVEQDGQSYSETLVDVVKEKESVAEELLSVEDNKVEEEISEVVGGHEEMDGIEEEKDETDWTSDKLRENRAPHMFNSDEPDMDVKDRGGNIVLEGAPEIHEARELLEEPRLEEMFEGGFREYGGAQSVPSSLASYFVQKGHEDNVRRYSEKRQEGEIPLLIDTCDKLREEEQLNMEGKATDIEKSMLVGVDVLLGAIHTAEQLQAEIDGRAFREQLDKIQEIHKSEVKDFQAKVFAYAEDTDRLEKELKQEKALSEEALKLQLQKAEERLEMELKRIEERLQLELRRKKDEAKQEKEKLEILGKAHTAAAVAREKADHLEDMHALQLQVNALRTAFYTHSEEARVSHTAHKLAMGAFALEDAIDKGKPVEKEAELLVASAGGPGGDPVVDAVLSSIPPEVLTAGSRTRPQLHHAFTRLKSPLRELVLIPAGGGGVFTHLFAKVTANLKIREEGSDDVGDEGIEVVIGKVDRLLAEGKLVEAAAILEQGVGGTAAESLAVEWAKQARNRAIIEQGLQVVQAHVVAIASGLS